MGPMEYPGKMRELMTSQSMEMVGLIALAVLALGVLFVVSQSSNN